MDTNAWASLPCNLLVEVLRRLASTAVVRCAAACRPWRRAIIGNASCLRPYPDCFNPNLLIGFFYRHWFSSYLARLQYVPGPFEHVCAIGAPASTPWDIWQRDHNPYRTSISCFIPWTAARGIDLVQYDKPLSCRDGFVLLGSGSNKSKVTDLCLCNPLARTCRVIPAAALGAFKTCTYVLVTDDGDGTNDSTNVWVLAVRREEDVKRGVIYQIFSSAAGEWGAVKRSAKFEKGLSSVDMRGLPNDMVVCQGSVYWLVRLFVDDRLRGARRNCRCVFAIDVRTERTWTMELPEKYKVVDSSTCYYRFVLAMSEEGQLSLILQLWNHQIEVWVLAPNGEWALRRAINLHSLIPDCLKEGKIWLIIMGFCPRSGCLFGDYDRKDLLIDVNTGSLRPAGTMGIGRETKYPYEMDWSTYLSKMKYF